MPTTQASGLSSTLVTYCVLPVQLLPPGRASASTRTIPFHSILTESFYKYNVPLYSKTLHVKLANVFLSNLNTRVTRI